jgi:hypothetical protein
MSAKDEQIKFLQYRVEALEKELQGSICNKNFTQVRDDLQYFYEIDLDNCKMTNVDWIREIALLIVTQNYKAEILQEVEDYKKQRKEL